MFGETFISLFQNEQYSINEELSIMVPVEKPIKHGTTRPRVMNCT